MSQAAASAAGALPPVICEYLAASCPVPGPLAGPAGRADLRVLNPSPAAIAGATRSAADTAASSTNRAVRKA